MNALSLESGNLWLRTHGWINLDTEYLRNKLQFNRRYSIPVDTGRKTALARCLSKLLDSFSGAKFLWITDFDIWPSSENIELFDAYRRSLGEKSTLSEKPCHVFNDGNIVQLECFLDVILYFFWDVIVVDSVGDIALRISNDEYMDIYLSQLELIQRINYQEIDLLCEAL